MFVVIHSFFFFLTVFRMLRNRPWPRNPGLGLAYMHILFMLGCLGSRPPSHPPGLVEITKKLAKSFYVSPFIINMLDLSVRTRKMFSFQFVLLHHRDPLEIRLKNTLVQKRFPPFKTFSRSSPLPSKNQTKKYFWKTPKSP